MPRHPHEVSRDELLARLGKEASPAKLLRWHHWGFLPQPRRDGHGRGRGGSTSYYPEIAVLQSYVIARLLQTKRHSVEAGWGLWALGFREPATAWVRHVLRAQLKEQEAVLRDRSRQERELKRVRSARQRPVAGTEALHQRLEPEAVAGALALLIEMEQGAYRPEDHKAVEYYWLEEAILTTADPYDEDESSYPGGVRELAVEGARLAREAPLAATRRLVETLPDPVLRAYANEAQLLYEFLHRPSTLEASVMPRSFFIGYLRSQILSPTGQVITRKLRRAMGWTQPPRSPLGRVIAQLA